MSRYSIYALAAAAAAALSISAAVPASAGAFSAHLGHLTNTSKLNSAAFAARSQSAFRPGSWVMLNPQPLPPRYQSSASHPGGWVMLNPQPLPPGAAFR